MIDTVLRALSYLRANPQLLFRAAENALKLEISIPMELVRWAIDRRPRGKGPESIDLFDADPALGVSLTVDLYGTKLSVAAKIGIESIDNGEQQLTVELRVRDLQVKAPPGSPAAMMIQSLDLSRPGNLLKMMPMRHTLLVNATDDLFVLDLFKIRALAGNQRLRQALAALSFIRIAGVRVDRDLLAIGLDVSPLSIPAAFRRARTVAVG
jgi:hypothetical protein